jgi:hypothetical protein
MEVTDLKGLKRLMKGDATNKFEFVEEDGDHEQFGDLEFGYPGGSSKTDNPGATYNTYKPATQAADGNKYKDLSSDDSELMDQEQPKGHDYDEDNEKTLEDIMYDAPTIPVQAPAKRNITGPIEEEEDEDQTSSDDGDEETKQGASEGFVVIDSEG